MVEWLGEGAMIYGSEGWKHTCLIFSKYYPHPKWVFTVPWSPQRENGRAPSSFSELPEPCYLHRQQGGYLQMYTFPSSSLRGWRTGVTPVDSKHVYFSKIHWMHAGHCYRRGIHGHTAFWGDRHSQKGHLADVASVLWVRLTTDHCVTGTRWEWPP